MTELERKFEIVRASKGAIESYLFDRTVGIVAHDGGPRPIEHGTGILLELEEEPIILTAGHVISPYPVEKLQILATRQMSNVRVMPGDKKFIGAKNAEVDLGFLRLTDETRDGLRERKFFTLQDLEVFPTKLETDLPAIFGLPEFERKEKGASVFRYGTLCYFANNLEDVDWHAMEELPRSLMIEYPDEVEDVFSKSTQNLCDPRGMSGGGTWRVGYNQGSKLWSPYSMRLIAVNVEVFEMQEMDFIRAVRVEPVLEFLGEHFPSARKYLDLSREDLERRRA